MVGVTALVGALGGTAFAAESAETSAVRAKAKVKRVTQPFELPPQATNFGVADSSATCPGGTTLVGGGATLDPATPLTADIELFKSGPFDQNWNVRYNNNLAAAQQASVAAICLNKNLKVTGADGKPKAKSKVRQVVEQVQLPPQATDNGVAEYNVSCPSATKLVGGGASFASTVPNLRVTLFESGPQGNAWHVRYDRDGATSEPATVTAICLKSKLKLKGGPRQAKARSKVTQVTQQVQLPPQATDAGVAQFDVSCPGGTTVVGGGGLLPAGSPLATTVVELFESGPRGNGWHVRFNNDLAVAQAASVHALCLRNKLKVK